MGERRQQMTIYEGAMEHGHGAPETTTRDERSTPDGGVQASGDDEPSLMGNDNTHRNKMDHASTAKQGNCHIGSSIRHTFHRLRSRICGDAPIDDTPGGVQTHASYGGKNTSFGNDPWKDIMAGLFMRRLSNDFILWVSLIAFLSFAFECIENMAYMLASIMIVCISAGREGYHSPLNHQKILSAVVEIPPQMNGQKLIARMASKFNVTMSHKDSVVTIYGTSSVTEAQKYLQGMVSHSTMAAPPGTGPPRRPASDLGAMA